MSDVGGRDVQGLGSYVNRELFYILTLILLVLLQPLIQFDLRSSSGRVERLIPPVVVFLRRPSWETGFLVGSTGTGNP